MSRSLGKRSDLVLAGIGHLGLSVSSTANVQLLDGRAAVRPLTISPMGAYTRQRLFGKDHEKIGDYNRHHVLIARCHCEHQRELNIQLLIKAFGEQTPLSKIRQHLRCFRCGRRDPAFKVNFKRY